MGIALPPPAILFVEEPAEIEIRNGLVCCTMRSGELVIEVRCRPETLATSVTRATKAYTGYLAGSTAAVVSLAERRDRVARVEAVLEWIESRDH